MIGDFMFSNIAMDPDTVYVSLSWGANRKRMARLIVPGPVAAVLVAGGFPTPDQSEMSIASSLSYAIYIGLLADVPVCLTGEASVWDAAWGNLCAQGQIYSLRRS